MARTSLALLMCFLTIHAAYPQMIFTGNHRKISASAPSACGSTITGVLGDYWSGSYSSSPITTNWTDSNGGQTINPTGSPTWANNTFGTGLPGVTMNGTSQFFSMSTTVVPSSSFANLAVYTVVKTPSSSGALYGNHANVAALLLQAPNGSGKVELDVQNRTLLCQSSSSLSPSTIYEISAIYNGTNCQIYINGTLDVTNSISASVTAGIDRVGANDSGASYAGSIYEIIFSNNTSYQSGAHSCWVAKGLP